jgi:hypothetical protein
MQIPDTPFRLAILLRENKPAGRKWQGHIWIDGTAMKARWPAAKLNHSGICDAAWVDEIHSKLHAMLVGGREQQRSLTVRFGSPVEIQRSPVPFGEWFLLGAMNEIREAVEK